VAKANGAAYVINYAKEDFLARVKEITGADTSIVAGRARPLSTRIKTQTKS
jgi:NADPH:quinone reductase-like Zn-dependent oxidoreductase